MMIKIIRNLRGTVWVIVFAALSLTAAGCSQSEEQTTSQATTDGYAKLQALHAHEDSLMTQYKVLDKKKGIYRIPVERALELIARENKK